MLTSTNSLFYRVHCKLHYMDFCRCRLILCRRQLILCFTECNWWMNMLMSTNVLWTSINSLFYRMHYKLHSVGFCRCRQMTTSTYQNFFVPNIAPALSPGRMKRRFDREPSEGLHIDVAALRRIQWEGGYFGKSYIAGCEMEKLMSKGYVLTVLAPNDEPMGQLTTHQLSESTCRSRRCIIIWHSSFKGRRVV